MTSPSSFPVTVNMNHAVVVEDGRLIGLSEVTGVLLSSQQTRTMLDVDSLPYFPWNVLLTFFLCSLTGHSSAGR